MSDHDSSETTQLLKAVSALASRVGQVEATAEGIQNALRDLRTDLRSSGVNWLGILGLIVAVTVPIASFQTSYVDQSHVAPNQLLALHEKRIDNIDGLLLERAERIASLEARDEYHDRIAQYVWENLERKGVDAENERSRLQAAQIESLQDQIARLEIAMGHIRAAFPDNLPGGTD